MTSKPKGKPLHSLKERLAIAENALKIIAGYGFTYDSAEVVANRALVQMNIRQYKLPDGQIQIQYV